MAEQNQAQNETPNDKKEEREMSFFEKMQHPLMNDPDCVPCKITAALTCYGAGALVLSNVKSVPRSNQVGRVSFALFGVTLIISGTCRLFV